MRRGVTGTRPRRRTMRALPRSSAGIALIMALWLTILLTVIASGFAFSTRTEALSARNAMSQAQARAAADGAVDRTAFELMRPRNLKSAWVADGQPHAWKEDEIALQVNAVDESSRIDLNTANDQLLMGLLTNVGGLDAEAARRVLDAILDWRDPDDLRRPNGAEAADYKAAGRKYLPANAGFETVGELLRVLGVTPALHARIADSLTVHSRQPGINTATATRDALLALPNVTADLVDAFIAQRDNAREAGLPPPPFPAAQAFAGVALPVWRIRAEARMPDGVTFVRDAVLRPTGDPRRSAVTLLWQEGGLAASAPADPGSSGTTGVASATAGAYPATLKRNGNNERTR